jgi:hypothetical protein
MMRSYKKAALAVLGVSAALLGGNAHSSVAVNGGVVTATGAHVTYTFNQADLGLSDPLTSVSLVGDDLHFEPDSINASGFGFPEWTMPITVTAHSGYQLSSFALTESGSYSLGAGGFLDVEGAFEVRDNFAPNGHFVPAVLAVSLTSATTWTGQTGPVLPGAGWGENGIFDDAVLTITNMLIVSDASVSKDFVSIATHVTAVPEAETYALMLAGLGLVGLMARRRARTRN